MTGGVFFFRFADERPPSCPAVDVPPSASRPLREEDTSIYGMASRIGTGRRDEDGQTDGWVSSRFGECDNKDNLVDASLLVLRHRNDHPPATASIDDIGFKDRYERRNEGSRARGVLL
jgi:hypothetical protein